MYVFRKNIVENLNIQYITYYYTGIYKHRIKLNNFDLALDNKFLVELNTVFPILSNVEKDEFKKEEGRFWPFLGPARRKIPPSGYCRRGLELSKNTFGGPENFLENPENSGIFF